MVVCFSLLLITLVFLPCLLQLFKTGCPEPRPTICAPCEQICASWGGQVHCANGVSPAPPSPTCLREPEAWARPGPSVSSSWKHVVCRDAPPPPHPTPTPEPCRGAPGHSCLPHLLHGITITAISLHVYPYLLPIWACQAVTGRQKRGGVRELPAGSDHVAWRHLGLTTPETAM